MNLSFYIARRYLFSKKSHNAINIISMISVCGIVVATIALVCTLSVFNGFSKIVSDSFSVFDPDLTITPIEGKVFDPKIINDKVLKIEEVESVSESLEENALARNGDGQVPVLVKGVAANYNKIIDVDNFIVYGAFILQEQGVECCVSGLTLAMNLGIKSNADSPLELYSPKRNSTINLSNPSNAFTRKSVYPSGVFSLNQPKYDDNTVIVSLDLARELFDYDKEISALNIKLKENANVNRVKKEISNLIGKDFLVKNQYEQQADSFRMINIEKWVTFLILSFILLIAAFNIVGSLSMLIIDKKNDIEILQNMGARKKLILRVFMLEGWLISISGTLIGLFLGVIICLAQQYLGIIKLSQSPGLFIVDAYPVDLQAMDVFYIFITVSIIAFLIVLYPINNLKRKIQD